MRQNLVSVTISQDDRNDSRIGASVTHRMYVKESESTTEAAATCLAFAVDQSYERLDDKFELLASAVSELLIYLDRTETGREEMTDRHAAFAAAACEYLGQKLDVGSLYYHSKKGRRELLEACRRFSDNLPQGLTQADYQRLLAERLSSPEPLLEELTVEEAE